MLPDLSEADLGWANLSEATLSEAKLNDADLSGANLSKADLPKANLNRTALVKTDFYGANLSGADLSRAFLIGANLLEANFSEVDLTKAGLGLTTFPNVDLRTVRGGLETVTHMSPSTIGIDTIYCSKGQIPEAFLRGCGVPDSFIEFAKLYQEGISRDEINTILYRVQELRAGQPVQISPLFISYSHADSAFVDVMEEHLDERGVRFWRDVHHATAGRLETQIDRAIRHNATVLLVLSENSVQSDWVQHEARLARKLEIETGRDVLCPVALDDSWKTCRWPKRLREQITEYNILDFSSWENEGAFEEMFGRLIEGLDLFYE